MGWSHPGAPEALAECPLCSKHLLVTYYVPATDLVTLDTLTYSMLSTSLWREFCYSSILQWRKLRHSQAK